MNKAQKLEYLKEYHLDEWLRTRRKVYDELSAKQELFCICGRMATGFHERGCRRFQARVDSETIKALKPLWTPWHKKAEVQG